MSKAVIEFCEHLEKTLLTVEERLMGAQKAFGETAAGVQSDARKQVDAAAEELRQLQAVSGVFLEAIKADLPAQRKALQERFGEFGIEAQLALRHALVSLAEVAAKGAKRASGALDQGAVRAQQLAEELRRKNAVAPAPAAPTNKA
jgi:hypothetical protein